MADTSSFKILWSLFYLLGALAQAGQSNLLVTRQAQHRRGALQEFEVMAPPDVPRGGKPCEVVLLQHTFGWSYGKPAKVSYTPPTGCGKPGSWASVVFSLTTSSQGHQYDRLGLLYLDGVEVWRTSTAEPITKGVIWTVRRDMTRYMPLLAKPNELLFSINNILDQKLGLTGSYEVTLSASFYEPTPDYPAAKKQLDEIVTVGNTSGLFVEKIEQHLNFPQNIASAFVEIYASGASQEEFWYTNVPDQYIPRLDPTNTAGLVGRGAFREVQLWIDGILAGVVYPFPVVYTGGLMLTWWRPIAGIGAFEAPSFTLDITPFVPSLADGRTHNFTINVQGDGSGNQSTNTAWILSGSVGFSLDPSRKKTTGKILDHQTSTSVKTTPISQDTKGHLIFTTTASRDLELTAEVQTGSSAPQKVRVKQKLNYSNKQTWTSGGASQRVEQSSDGSTVSSYNDDQALSDSYTFPLDLTLEVQPGKNSQTLLNGRLSHGYTREETRPFSQAWNTEIATKQDSDGQLVFDKGGNALGGFGRTSQRYSYKDGRKEDYARDVEIYNVTHIVKDTISGSLAHPGSVDAGSADVAIADTASVNAPQRSLLGNQEAANFEGALYRTVRAQKLGASGAIPQAYLENQQSRA
ncbi:hypothetical protein CROQUDRAFT_724471 [Cronartium quercuum f. sp. fusiforme G11]|uniref:Peptide N-acetyl-beta-D-glucosaminyl asparaginase amidase A N-terminal domain-containing protein n=1 Tax=Cronartium quercuum f. sp. fusiforme G11 TaxID=708437 RepID=A0A9P6NCU1_9BASI|nr:hypothetical protein CROQUDRAFT_724471 [Cronartium quercuum f. sp. fusiforme G11]